MSYAARAQASHGRLRSHFGSLSVTIRDGIESGATTMTVDSEPPVAASVFSDTGSADEYILYFDHSDPLRTFVPAVGDPVSWSATVTVSAFDGRIVRIEEEIADEKVGYRLTVGGGR